MNMHDRLIASLIYLRFEFKRKIAGRLVEIILSLDISVQVFKTILCINTIVWNHSRMID